MRDVVIVGGGPAGLSAAVYAKRAMLDSVLIEKSPVGAGQIAESDRVDNYLGLLGENGYALALKFRNHAAKVGVEFVTGEAVKIRAGTGYYIVWLADGEKIETKTIIFALGANRKKLEIKGEQELTGKGVSYCAVCDGAFCRGKTVVVVGGGDTAAGDAVLLSKIAEKVILVHRGSSLRASHSLQQQLADLNNVQLMLNASLTEIIGDSRVTGVALKCTSGNKTLSVSGVFVAVGTSPNSQLLKELVQCDSNGYVLADETGETSAKGIFVAGDVRTKPVKQVITAVADGANCVFSAEKYLQKIKAYKK